MEMLHAERQRRPRARGRIVQRSVDTHIRWLERQVIDTDATLEAASQASPLWRVQDQLLQSVPRVGPPLSPAPCSGCCPSWASSACKCLLA
jgi:hypothetical protein